MRAGRSPEHGNRSRYVQGCRCEPCGLAEREYSREYHRKRRAGVDTSTTARIPCPETLDADVLRFVGAFLGDGWVRQSAARSSGYSVGLAIGTSQDAHSARYQALCESLFAGSRWRLDAPGAFGLSCSSKSIHTWLNKRGLGDESPKREIPTYVGGCSIPEKLALLAGLIDADGSVSANPRNRGRATLSLASEALVHGAHNLAVECLLEPTPVAQYSGVSNFGAYTCWRFTVKASTVHQLDLWHEEKASRLVRPTVCVPPHTTS
jgi:hypothetical protein